MSNVLLHASDGARAPTAPLGVVRSPSARPVEPACICAGDQASYGERMGRPRSRIGARTFLVVSRTHLILLNCTFYQMLLCIRDFLKEGTVVRSFVPLRRSLFPALLPRVEALST